jgi:hypothetical protein
MDSTEAMVACCRALVIQCVHCQSYKAIYVVALTLCRMPFAAILKIEIPQCSYHKVVATVSEHRLC